MRSLSSDRFWIILIFSVLQNIFSVFSQGGLSKDSRGKVRDKHVKKTDHTKQQVLPNLATFSLQITLTLLMLLRMVMASMPLLLVIVLPRVILGIYHSCACRRPCWDWKFLTQSWFGAGEGTTPRKLISGKINKSQTCLYLHSFCAV